MKTMKFQTAFLLVICMLFTNFTLFAQTHTDELYRTSMEKALGKLDSAKNVAELTDSRNLFERIAGKYDNQWLPAYYVAYIDVQKVYLNPGSDQNQAHLDSARAMLEKLETYADVDMSEVHTLWGYYHNAALIMNPASAQTIFGKVVDSYRQALEVNPDNPRAVILRVFFNQMLPDFVQQKLDPATEVERAKQLFAKNLPGIEKPYWGQYFIGQVKVN